jgi:hypothetical protein
MSTKLIASAVAVALALTGCGESRPAGPPNARLTWPDVAATGWTNGVWKVDGGGAYLVVDAATGTVGTVGVAQFLELKPGYENKQAEINREIAATKQAPIIASWAFSATPYKTPTDGQVAGQASPVIYRDDLIGIACDFIPKTGVLGHKPAATAAISIAVQPFDTNSSSGPAAQKNGDVYNDAEFTRIELVKTGASTATIEFVNVEICWVWEWFQAKILRDYGKGGNAFQPVAAQRLDPASEEAQRIQKTVEAAKAKLADDATLWKRPDGGLPYFGWTWFRPGAIK